MKCQLSSAATIQSHPQCLPKVPPWSFPCAPRCPLPSDCMFFFPLHSFIPDCLCSPFKRISVRTLPHLFTQMVPWSPCCSVQWVVFIPPLLLLQSHQHSHPALFFPGPWMPLGVFLPLPSPLNQGPRAASLLFSLEPPPQAILFSPWVGGGGSHPLSLLCSVTPTLISLAPHLLTQWLS